jgi:predicted extracellular nuclease
VITSLHPDIVTIQEGPSDVREMLLFTESYLTDSTGQPLFDVFGGLDGGAQKIYALVRRNGEFEHVEIPDDSATATLAEPWEADVDGDLQVEGYEFTRLPLVVTGRSARDGTALHVVSLHTKSKYVHKGQNLWNNPETRQRYIVAALKNRRRISSEAMRLRQYLDELLSQSCDTQIVVTGDFNDGPGVDFFERRYLTHNITDILLGSTFRPELLFKHAFLTNVPGDKRFTAIFDDFVDDIPNRKLVLDHIIVSPSLAARSQGGIAHDQYNTAIDESASSRQKYPSDHRPVFVDI